MMKRFLGLDIAPGRTRLFVLAYDKGQLREVELLESGREDLLQQLTELQEKWRGEFRISDRLAAALPAKTAYVRELQFPFHDKKKISAALPHEINMQIPLAVEECALAVRYLCLDKDGPARVSAAAVPTQSVRAILEPADRAALPLHILDLQPFALISGLGGRLSDGILVSAGEVETTISLLLAGQPVDYRLLPGTTDLGVAERIAYIEREIRALLVKAGQPDVPVYVTGTAVDDEMLRRLGRQGHSVEKLALRLAGEEIPEAYIAAASLALRAATNREQHSFNFRRGPFALKGEWQKIKKSLIAMACLLCLILTTLTGSAVLNYHTKTVQIDTLQQSMVKIYRQTFPDADRIVDITLQMQRAHKDLRTRSALIGGSSPGALAVLKSVSALPDTARVVITELGYSLEEVRLRGHAESFESVNRISEHLAASPLFTKVQIAEAQMTPAANKINFRLILHLVGEETSR